MSEEEKSEELVALEEARAGVGMELTRLKSLHAKGRLTENLADEIVSTVLPLIEELASATTAFADSTEEWADEIDEVVDNVAEGGPTLDLQEVQLFGWLLQRLQDFVSGVKSNPDAPDEAKKAMVEIEVKIGLGLGVLQKFVPEDEDEDEDGEENEELEEGEGDESAATADDTSTKD